jgi:hypothetical protein
MKTFKQFMENTPYDREIGTDSVRKIYSDCTPGQEGANMSVAPHSLKKANPLEVKSFGKNKQWTPNSLDKLISKQIKDK